MATHIKDIIGKFIEKNKKKQEGFQKIEQIKNELLDQETKEHIHFQKMLKNQIIFSSDSSVFSYNFNLQKEAILKEIQQEIPGIKKILVRVG